MCQCGCNYEDYNGDCTHEERGQALGCCPIMINERKKEMLKAIFLDNQKCSNCILNEICDREVDNYRKDVCQIIENYIEGEN